jgi:hypothetical protein
MSHELRMLAASMQGSGLIDEAETRWRLMETAWALELPRTGIAMQTDASQNLLFVERARLINLAGVRAALNGYQRGRCFYCRAETSLAATGHRH